MKAINNTAAGMLAAAAFALPVAAAAAATPHHIHLATSSASESVKWYVEHLDCDEFDGRVYC